MFNQLQITSLLVRNIQAKETTIEPYIIHFSLNQVTEKQKYLILYCVVVHFIKPSERNREMLCDNAAKYY